MTEVEQVGRVGWAGALTATLLAGCGGLDEASTSGSETDGGTSGSSATAITVASTSSPPTTAPADSASGEVSTADTGNGATADTGTTTGADASTTSTTSVPPPLVLAHGFFGFDDFAGAGFVDYFWGVSEALHGAGEVHVFTPEVDPFNNSTVRGEQLLAHVEAVLEETGAQRVNLIGHSQGGLDARVVASMRPDLVESVTTIATPHGGTPLADLVLALVPPGESPQAVADALIQFFGAALWGEIGPDTSVLESLRQFSDDGIEDFNINYPDADGVSYYSVAGRSDWHRGGSDCEVPLAPPFVQQYADERDPIDPLFALAEAAIDGPLLNPIPNDGLVRARDAMHGEFWGCIPADHVDQIGHLFGDNPGLGNTFDHLAFHVDLVAHLRSLGH